jgi:hypothetical protein
MTVIIIIGVVLGIGAIFLLRSPPASTLPTMSDADALLLRDEVLRRLRERLVGWTFDVPADKPLELTAIEGATERRIQMNLQRLGEAWFPFHARQQTEQANDQIEAFVLGATGQSEGEDLELDNEGMKDVLALRLVPADKVPANSISLPAGTLAAVLVLRTDRAEPVTQESLDALKLSAAEAFRIAYANLERDVEEGLPLEVLDETTPPGALAIAPNDPLAPSYALVPALAARLKKKLGNRDGLLYVDATSLVAAVGDVEIEREEPLIAEGVALGALGWKPPA